jgi:DNA modification methylase
MMVTTDVHRVSLWSFADLTRAETQYLTHGYHRYPAKFIPQLVRQLIEEYSRSGDRICDPFGGCGTTLVEAKLANRASLGFDINPVAVLITRAKTTSIHPSALSERFTNLCEDLENGVVESSQTAESPLNLDRLLYWFGESNLEQILSLKTRLGQEENAAIRRFFLCMLSHVLKNCSYWLTASTKPQKDPHKVPESPTKAFMAHASRMLERNRAFFNELQKLGPSEPLTIMRKADARKLPLPDECIDLIITSPPYSTSYEYSDIHQLSAFLFGFCTSLSDFRCGFIGSKNGNHHRDETLANPKALETVRDLRLADPRVANAVHNYFIDMNRVYREIHRVLRTAGRACIVIGDTELRGVLVPNAEVAVDQMEHAGLFLERAIERPVPGRALAPFRDKSDGRFTSPKNPAAKKVYSHEYILILRKK